MFCENQNANCHLREVYMLYGFSAISTKEDTHVTSCLLSSTTNTFEKGVCTERKEFALLEQLPSIKSNPLFARETNTLKTELPLLQVIHSSTISKKELMKIFNIAPGSIMKVLPTLVSLNCVHH